MRYSFKSAGCPFEHKLKWKKENKKVLVYENFLKNVLPFL